MKNDTIQTLYDKLAETGVSAKNAPETYAFLNALKQNTVFFEIENWYGFKAVPVTDRKESLPAEMLLRIYDQDNNRIDPEKALIPLYKAGLGTEIDSLLVTKALHQARQKDALPVSVNIAAESALSEEFWIKMEPVLSAYNPQDIVFEILEPDVPENATPAMLERMRAKGFRFALDDVLHDSQSEERLAFFGPHVDFVKIDGSAIRHEFDEGGKLRHLVETIRDMVPHAHLIAEWVRSVKEATDLNEKFSFAAVQGASLRHSMFGLKSNLNTATGQPELRP